MPLNLFFRDPNPDGADQEVLWARGRLPDRTYVHRTFTLQLPASRDHGCPARYIVKVFDEPAASDPGTEDLQREEWIVQTTPAGRRQIKLQVARSAGQVRELTIHRVPAVGDGTQLEHLLTLDRDGATRLVELIHALEHIPVEGGERTVRVDDQLLRDILAAPSAMSALYERDPEAFRRLITEDSSAEDVVAVAHRRVQVQRFRDLLAHPDVFAHEQQQCGGSMEKVWQRFLEENPWILGIGLTGQLLTSWSNERLEQIVAGFSIAGPGKRTDALMRTSGRIRSMVFAEIKHHETDLLATSEYRSGCWAPSAELTGAVTQIHQTVHMATQQIGQRLADLDDDGVETGELTHLLRPRSFLIVGNLDQLRSPHGIQPQKFQSFELYRRNLYEPEIVTFDELLARAEWHVQLP
jgi:hypothetical protein